jgi:hypothetical protein
MAFGPEGGMALRLATVDRGVVGSAEGRGRCAADVPHSDRKWSCGLRLRSATLPWNHGWSDVEGCVEKTAQSLPWGAGLPADFLDARSLSMSLSCKDASISGLLIYNHCSLTKETIMSLRHKNFEKFNEDTRSIQDARLFVPN